MGGLLHLVQQGWAWAGCGPAQFPPRCTKCDSTPTQRPVYQLHIVRCGTIITCAVKGLKKTTNKRSQNKASGRQTDCWTFQDVFRASRENVAQSTRRRRSRSSCWWCCTVSRHPSRSSCRSCCRRRRCRRRRPMSGRCRRHRRRHHRRRWWPPLTWLAGRTALTKTARWTRCANDPTSRPCCAPRGEWSCRAVRPHNLPHTSHLQQSLLPTSFSEVDAV